MKTRVALAAATLTVGLLGANATQADARGDGWEKVPDPEPYAITDCGTTMTFTTTVNREWERVSSDDQGNVTVQTTGAYKVLVTAEDGRSAMINASGPYWQMFAQDGTYTYAGKGLNLFNFTPEQAAFLGLPDNAVMAGPFTVQVNPDDSLTLLRAPAHVWSVCDLLK